MNWSKTTGDRFEAVCWTASSRTEKVIEVTVTSPLAIACSEAVEACLPTTCPAAVRAASSQGTLVVWSATIEMPARQAKASTTSTGTPASSRKLRHHRRDRPDRTSAGAIVTSRTSASCALTRSARPPRPGHQRGHDGGAGRDPGAGQLGSPVLRPDPRGRDHAGGVHDVGRYGRPGDGLRRRARDEHVLQDPATAQHSDDRFRWDRPRADGREDGGGRSGEEREAPDGQTC